MHTSITNVAWCALKYCVSESSLHEWLSLFCPYYVLKRRRYVSFCLEYIVRVLLTNLSNTKRLSLHFFHTRNVAAFIRINLNPLKRHIVIYMICMHLWGRIVMRTHARIKPIFRFDFAVAKKNRTNRTRQQRVFICCFWHWRFIFFVEKKRKNYTKFHSLLLLFDSFYFDFD